MLNGMLAVGMNMQIAECVVEINAITRIDLAAHKEN